jgi:hypothetical protein
MKISIQVTSNKLGALAARLPQQTHEVVAASLLRVQDSCRRRSRVDTGAMRDGWAVSFSGPTDGEVSNPVPHAVFNEYGTVNMTAQPMLRPSIDEERPHYVAALARILTELG